MTPNLPVVNLLLLPVSAGLVNLGGSHGLGKRQIGILHHDPAEEGHGTGSLAFLQSTLRLRISNTGLC